jgi:hypothetical protein
MSNVEVNGESRAANKPGLYRHPESGAEVVVTHHPKLGSAMADGVVQVGYKWVGPAPTTKASAEPKAEVTK